MKKKNKTIVVVAAGLAALAVAALFLMPSKKSALTLSRTQVMRVDMSNSVTATGTIEPVTKVEVGTQVSGIINKLYVDYNDVVTAGQLIAEMDKVTLQAEYTSAQSEVASSKTEFEYRQKAYNRTKALYDKQLVSDAEYDEVVYMYEKAKNAYDQSRAALVRVKRNLSYATITSPIDGVVISRAVEEGQTVAAGFSTPTLFTIAADLTQMQVIADVDEADIGQVAEGQRVEFTVDAYPDDTFEGKVEQVRLEATTTSNVVTYEVVISAYNPDLKLKPGLTANITIITMEKEGAMAVPTKSLRFHPDEEIAGRLGMQMIPLSETARKRVWVIDGISLVETAVETGMTYNDLTEITAGLTGSETVATAVETKEEMKTEEGSAERSPFMPQRPGGKK